jgi:hypothetical protein
MAWHHWCRCDRCGGARPVDGQPDRVPDGPCPPEFLSEDPPGRLCRCFEQEYRDRSDIRVDDGIANSDT